MSNLNAPKSPIPIKRLKTLIWLMTAVSSLTSLTCFLSEMPLPDHFGRDDLVLRLEKNVTILMLIWMIAGSSVQHNPVPLLPTDGGYFVAFQKKSLAELADPPHLVRISVFSQQCCIWEIYMQYSLLPSCRVFINVNLVASDAKIWWCNLGRIPFVT